ncbi:hypothetical protein PR202_gb08811 [Eleusine coracana subsp. coracana]|uniref:TPX2 C-terminal domain-containing protein n=1 Tax=Eleusine coracana subsp. coracana TaxID=191504 RepID=A0AAV5EFN4_ELECO|nr:hypothetical protein PR202_gb08811 [Eleusine coracana subsp. coracana]
MAADVGQRFSGWTYSDLPYNDHIPQKMVLDHGSVSFGRFAAEPLSWEKRSVFAHNSRQEELSKLTAPGLVAQKKAFFEEYYKRARQLKAQGATQQAQAASEEETNHADTVGRSSQEDQLPTAIPDDAVASAPSSSFVPTTEVSSSDERKCQDAHEIGYLTFNPLFSQAAAMENIQQEEMSSSDKNQYIDQEFPCATNTSSNHGHTGEGLERKVLAPRRVVSNDNCENNVAETRIVLPIASLESDGLKVVCEKQGARKNTGPVNRPIKRSKGLSTSVIHIPRVDFRRNSENRPSQDLKDPFHRRVEMKLRALSDRMSAEKAAASSRSASYQPPDRAMTTRRVLAPSKSAAQASHRSPKGVHADALPHGILFKKDSSISHVASSNSNATGKSAAKILVMPSSSQVSAKTSRSAQVTSKGAAELTRVNNAPQNKRKQLSTPAADENNPKRGYLRRSMPRSARSSSDNCPPNAKAPKVANRTNETKSEFVQKSRAASHPVPGRNNINMTKATVNNEQNRKRALEAFPVASVDHRN